MVLRNQAAYSVRIGRWRLCDISTRCFRFPDDARIEAGGRVVVEGLPASSHQTDLRLLEVLEKMGCQVERAADHVEVRGPEGELRAVDVDMNAMPDAVLALAVVALFADGPTTIRNIANLRIKETDRLAALQAELSKLGAGVEIGSDWIAITPGPIGPATIATYDDHRMAMGFAVAGMRQPGIVIEDPDCVAKTWPGFFEMLESL